MGAQFLILGEVLLAVFLGGLVGLERELSEKPAGLRTHMFVAGSAALLVALGNYLAQSYQNNGELAAHLRVDPLRILEAIIVGISFLGAGTIIQMEKEERVANLTTAASILFTAGIGISVALEQYYLSVGLTLLALVINFVMNIFEKWFVRKAKGKSRDE